MSSSRAVLLAAILIAGLAGAAGSALAVDAGASPAGNETISVTGSGEISVAPDAAVVRLAVTGTAETAANASEQVATDAAQLRERLANLGISDDNVRSIGYDVHERGEQRPDDESTRYFATQRFEVTLEDVDRAGTVIDAALGSGADEVHGVSFTLSESARDDARGQALRAAVDDAHGEADILAEATDLTLSTVRTVSTSGTHVTPYRVEPQAVADSGAGGTDIDTRDVTVHATVQVVYGAST